MKSSLLINFDSGSLTRGFSSLNFGKNLLKMLFKITVKIMDIINKIRNKPIKLLEKYKKLDITRIK